MHCNLLMEWDGIVLYYAFLRPGESPFHHDSTRGTEHPLSTQIDFTTASLINENARQKKYCFKLLYSWTKTWRNSRKGQTKFGCLAVSYKVFQLCFIMRWFNIILLHILIVSNFENWFCFFPYFVRNYSTVMLVGYLLTNPVVSDSIDYSASARCPEPPDIPKALRPFRTTSSYWVRGRPTDLLATVSQ